MITYREVRTVYALIINSLSGIKDAKTAYWMKRNADRIGRENDAITAGIDAIRLRHVSKQGDKDVIHDPIAYNKELDEFLSLNSKLEIVHIPFKTEAEGIEKVGSKDLLLWGESILFKIEEYEAFQIDWEKVAK